MLRLWDWHGEGVPLLLLHGFGMSARVWDPIARALPTRRVLAPDARGHGDSDPGPDPRTSYQSGLDDLASIVDALGLERFALAGHSMGASVALRYGAQHPERVERLILIDAGPDLPAAGTQRKRPIPRRTPPVTGFESASAYAKALGVLYPRALPETLLELAPHWLRRRADGRFEPKLDPTFLRSERANDDADRARWVREETDRLWSQLAGVRCPLLVVRGEHSTVLSGTTAQRMLAVSQHARLIELAGAGHTVMLDAPHALSAGLVDFLAWEPVSSGSLPSGGSRCR